MDMNLESKRQGIASRLVQREVFHCASSLMYGISQIMRNCPNFKDAFGDDPDDLDKLYQQDDWEEPGRAYLQDDADLDELETVAENFGYWSEILEEVGYQKYLDDHEAIRETWQAKLDAAREELDALPDDDERREGIEAQISDYQDCVDEEPKELDEWLDAHPSTREDLRNKVIDLIDDWAWVCNEFNLDPEAREVYEHWIVSDWLACELAGKGEVTGEFAGLTLWGRCTTGQAISLDGVIRQIAAELWPEEWNEEAAHGND